MYQSLVVKNTVSWIVRQPKLFKNGLQRSQTWVAPNLRTTFASQKGTVGQSHPES